MVGEVQAAIEPTDRRRAEIALAVDDGWSGRGLGRTLLSLIHRVAAPLGVETLTAEVLADNRRSAALLIASGMSFSVSAGVLAGSGPVRPDGPFGPASHDLHHPGRDLPVVSTPSPRVPALLARR